MKKIRFAMIGTGWRADFFIRIAKEISDRFELTSILCRSKEKGEKIAIEHNVKVVSNLDDLLADSPDFVVVCVAKLYAPQYMITLFEKGIPVLCETPPAITHESLLELYSAYKKYDAKVQIAEQYPFQPLYYSLLKAVENGIIGEVSNINISALHQYHAVCIMRKFLGVRFENVVISGKRYTFNVQQTDSRDALVKNGEITAVNRDRLTFEWENGKVGFFDFSPVQYHSFIRTRHLSVQGTKGEIDDTTIRYINDDSDCVTSELVRRDLGIYNNNHFCHHSIALDGKILYRNPFDFARLNDDEIAVASCLVAMKEYLETGKSFYSFEDGLQDGYIALCMEKAINDKEEVRTSSQPWA